MPDDTAVIPSDDPRGSLLAARTKARRLVFGHSPDADIRIEGVRSGITGSTARLTTPRGAIEVRTTLPGGFNVLNAAAAAACGIALGFDVSPIASGIEAVESVPGRLEPIAAGQPFAVFVDYAHTEESLTAAVDAVRELTSGRLIVVFGCGGDRDRGKRFGMGRAVATRADRVVVTSDNPRNEDPLAILRDVEAGVLSVSGAAARSIFLADRADAIRARAPRSAAREMRSSSPEKDTRRRRRSRIAWSRSMTARWRACRIGSSRIPRRSACPPLGSASSSRPPGELSSRAIRRSR